MGEHIPGQAFWHEKVQAPIPTVSVWMMPTAISYRNADDY